MRETVRSEYYVSGDPSSTKLIGLRPTDMSSKNPYDAVEGKTHEELSSPARTTRYITYNLHEYLDELDRYLSTTIWSSPATAASFFTLIKGSIVHWSSHM